MQLHVVPRRLVLRTPFTASGWTLTHRDVFIVSLTDPASGVTGWGEAAPLPSFGTESIEQCAAVLEEAVSAGSVLWDSDRLLRENAAEFLPALTGAPAARFALECAALDLAARRRGMPLRDFLRWDAGESPDGIESAEASRVKVNAVIGMGTPDETAARARHAVAEGFGCLKLKIGAASIDEDAARIRAVRLAVPEDVLLRLDANGAWDFSTAEEALREFSLYDIEYVEQPVPAADINELAALRELGIVPVAADESAQNLAQARALLARGAADLFVIKPMAAGGLIGARRFAREAAAQGCDVVFTSLVDSSIARHAVAQLCASLPGSHRHHGLATGDFFAEDTFRDRIERGYFLLGGDPGIGFTPAVGEERGGLERNGEERMRDEEKDEPAQ